ncbi:thioredoxin [bacterium]|nr:thioredoxin [bacterium]
MIHVNDSNFKETVLDSHKPVLVDFWAEWCMPCQMVAPAVEEIAKENDGNFKVCKLNVDEGRETAGTYGIMSIPTLALFKNGNMVEVMVGALPKESILEKIKPHLN